MEWQKAKDGAQRVQDRETEYTDALREATRVLPPPTHPTLATIDHQSHYA